MNKLLQLPELSAEVAACKEQGKKIVFTNGCFDILHPGHVVFLKRAREMGDALVVAVNSDRSVREIKGERRPILTEQERCVLLSGLECIDYITIFDDGTPRRVIQTLLPDVLVKGGDWGVEQIVGRKEVEAAGGRVVSLPYEPGYSSSGIIDRILQRYSVAR